MEEQRPMLTPEQLKEFHESAFERAKQNLMEHGRVMPLAIFAMDTDDPVGAMKRAGLGCEGEPEFWEGGPAVRIAMFPTALSPTEMVDMLCRIHPQLIEPTRLARAAAPLFPHPDGRTADDMILASVLKANDITHADALAEILGWLARTLSAYALVKIDEGWVRTCTPEERAALEDGPIRPVSESPDRQEVLLATMETRLGCRTKAADIIRERPNDESSRILRTEDRPDMEMNGGRFHGLLSRAN